MGGDLTIYLPGEPIPGYLSVPEESGPWPGVLVLHQAFGLDDDVRRTNDRLARMGYLSVAPDLLATGRIKCLAKLFWDVQRGRGESVDRLESLVAWLKARADCTGSVGVIGFCVGGGLAYLLGCSGLVDVTAPNYGKTPPDELWPRSCPVVASYGRRDRIFAKEAAKAEKALTRNEIVHDVKLYSEAGHSFMNQTEGHELMFALTKPFMAVGYKREEAEDAWVRIEGFFARYLR
jgi:carboxymethylenebutenolidase